MKLFCSNAFTGEDFGAMSNRMKMVVDTINCSGHEAYCPVFDSHKIDLQSRGGQKKYLNMLLRIFDHAMVWLQ